ncbi:MAG: arginase family protein [Bacteroidia bacterium]|nr:arginase family protein [Bacteroidia bacterium]
MKVIRSDFSALEGTNCYCSEESAAHIRQAVSSLPLNAVHMIGTGDYHYISLFWLERIQEPFTLVLFDNHPDDQPSAFSPDTLSCGSWVAEARKLKYCSEDYWISAHPESLVRKSVAARGLVNGRGPSESLGGMSVAKIIRARLSGCKGKTVYLSIDLDVLSKEFARTDWDQGTMSLDDLTEAVLELKKSTRIIGVDICGGLTIQKGASPEDLAINSGTEKALISLFE